jgi:acylphosphatase
MAKTRAHIFVCGRVQGVYFRQHTRRQAQIQGVVGWVRNLEDGRVEAVFEGEEAAVQAVVAYCRHGPSSAEVVAFEVFWEPFRGEFFGFEIAH